MKYPAVPAADKKRLNKKFFPDFSAKILNHESREKSRTHMKDKASKMKEMHNKIRCGAMASASYF